MRLLCFGLIFVASLGGCFGVSAQLPQATLTWIFPPGARAGSTNEVTVAGSDLDEPVGLQFSDSRISANAKPGTPSQFQIVVPPEVPDGVVDVRFAGRFGISNPRAFAVGRRPELIAAATNTSPTNAFELPLETTVNGRINANMVAWFHFAARAGQRLFIRVEARDFDSRLVPNLTVTDMGGRELTIARRREWLDFTAPSDGNYHLSLSDQTFRGGDDYYFRLTVTAGPQLDFALPNILRAGETNKVIIFGRNLPGGQPSVLAGSDGKLLEQISVEIVAPATISTSFPVEQLRGNATASIFDGTFSWKLEHAEGSSNPLPFALTTNAVVAADPSQMEEITIPCEFSGIFPQRGQLSGVTFRAEKGQVLWLELFADRLGFPSDAHGVVQRIRATKGENGETLYSEVLEWGDTDSNLGDREFNTTTRDAAVRFEAPQTGTYRVLVRDLFNLGDGRPRHPYRLSLRRESPDFRLVLFPMPPPRVGEDRKVHVLPAAIRRGQTIALKVLAFRRDGFNGDVELTATNLPAGVSIAPTRISSGQSVGTFLLTTSADAVTMTNAIIILGNATIGTNTVTREGALASVVWPVADFNNENATARLNRDAIFSVISAEAAPISIAAIETKAIEVQADGKLAVPQSIVRRGEFQGAFNLQPAGHSALDKAKEIAVPEKATNVTVEIDLAAAKLPVGTHTLWLRGTAAGKYRNNPEALIAAEAELQAVEKVLASVSEADRPKTEERKKAAEAAKKAAEEKAKPRDVTVMVYSQPFVVTVLPVAKPEEKK